MKPIKVLSLNGPWSVLVVKGIKKWETRSWSPKKYLGSLPMELYIHTSTFKKEDWVTMNRWPFKGYRSFFLNDNEELIAPEGAIIGKVTLRRVVPTIKEEVPEDQKDKLPLVTDWHDLNPGFHRAFSPDNEEVNLGNYSAGRYAWELINPVEFAFPIPMKGKLNIWDAEIAGQTDFLPNVESREITKEDVLKAYSEQIYQQARKSLFPKPIKPNAKSKIK